MKKKLTLLAMIAVVMTTSIFANPIEVVVNNQVLTSFSNKFEGAKDVTWSKTDLYMLARFVKDEQTLSAYFDKNGELIGVARNIVSKQLPLALDTELKKQIEGNWISELFEFNDGQETSYFVTLENGNQKLCLKSTGFNQWSIYKRIKKS